MSMDYKTSVSDCMKSVLIAKDWCCGVSGNYTANCDGFSYTTSTVSFPKEVNEIYESYVNWSKYKDYFKLKTGFNLNSEEFDEYYIWDEFFNGSTDNDKKNMCRNFGDLIECFKDNSTVDESLFMLSQTSCIYKFSESCYDGDYVPFREWIYGMFDVKYELDSGFKKEINNLKSKSKLNNGEIGMGVKVKKTENMSIDEFQKCDKAFDNVILKIDKDVYETFKKEYGVELFQVDCENPHIVSIDGFTIEFNDKAIRIFGKSTSPFIPYSFIESVECVYYISNN